MSILSIGGAKEIAIELNSLSKASYKPIIIGNKLSENKADFLLRLDIQKTKFAKFILLPKNQYYKF